jgi:hypothetical protein
MDIAQKALYNSLRISFLQDPSFAVEDWKVENYRAMPLDELFLQLNRFDISLDRLSFLAFADDHDSPESYAEALVADKELSSPEQDQVYLLLFELWRRLVPEKQCISVICDELDYQIFLCDSQALQSEEALVDALSGLYSVLEENVDHGIAPHEVFEAITEYLANDLEIFLVDYLSDLIEQKQYSYASELLEQFYPFMPQKKWFDLVHARLIGSQDLRRGHEMLKKIVQLAGSSDLQFNFDILSYLVSMPDHELFSDVARKSLSIIEAEEDLQELMNLSLEYFKNRNHVEKADLLEKLIERRKCKSTEELIQKSDPDLTLFEKVLL